MGVSSAELQGLKPKFKLGITKKTPLSLSDKLESNSSLDKEQDSIENMSADFPSLSKLNDHISELIQNNVFFIFIELLKRISTDYKDKGITFNELKTKYLSYFQNDLNHSNLFCDLLSANLETMDLNQLKQEINNGKMIIDKQPQLTISEKSIGSKSTISVTTPEDVSRPSPETSPTTSNGSNASADNDDFQVDITKCYARTANSKQCSRKKQKGQEFCGSHLHNQPHGRIDQAVDPSKNKPKRRGRPPKNMQKQSTNESQTTEVIQMDVNIETIHGIEYIVDNNGNIYKIPENFDSDEGINSDQLKLLGKKLPNNQITWYSENDLKFIEKSI